MASKRQRRAKREWLRQPYDVSHLTRLTEEEREMARNKIDPRAWIAENAPDNPIRVSDDDPFADHLGGRRILLGFANREQKQIPKLQDSPLQRPNLKALHFHSCVYHWEIAKGSLGLMGTKEGNEVLSQEILSMDYVESSILSIYNAIAVVEVFAEERLASKYGGKPVIVGGETDGNSDELLRDLLPGLFSCGKPDDRLWESWKMMKAARNAFTHKGATHDSDFEGICHAMERVLALPQNMEPPLVVKGLLEHYLGRELAWVQPVLNRAEKKAALYFQLGMYDLFSDSLEGLNDEDVGAECSAEFRKCEMKVRPLRDNVFVEVEKSSERTTRGGLILPSTVEDQKAECGIIVAVGPGRKMDSGERAPVSVKVGDRVAYSRYVGVEKVRSDGISRDIVALSEDSILGVFGEKSE